MDRPRGQRGYRRRFTSGSGLGKKLVVIVYSWAEVAERWERSRGLFGAASIPSAELDVFQSEQPILCAEAQKIGLKLFEETEVLLGPLFFIWNLVKEAHEGELGEVTWDD